MNYFRHIVLALGLVASAVFGGAAALLSTDATCPSPSSAATWPDCSRVFEKVDFTSGTISAVCGGKITKAALDAATGAVVDAGTAEVWPIGAKYGLEAGRERLFQQEEYTKYKSF